MAVQCEPVRSVDHERRDELRERHTHAHTHTHIYTLIHTHTHTRWRKFVRLRGPNISHLNTQGDKHDYSSLYWYTWPCNASPCGTATMKEGMSCGSDTHTHAHGHTQFLSHSHIWR